MNEYKLRFVPLGGIVGVTKNMYLYELYKDNELQDILIVDCGIGFPSVQDFGVDIEIPDISYLKDKTDKIRAVLLTHGHEDHITALRFHYKDLGEPHVYGSKLTLLFLEKKFKEYGLHLKKTQINYSQEYQFEGFRAKYIQMTHSIPDTSHILIKCPVGSFYHGSDFKMDLTPPFGPSPDFYEIAKAGREGTLCLMSDSLGSNREGFTLSESVVGKTFEDEIRTTKGKFIMTTFASNISRVRQCADAALKFNRKILLLGRSMVDNSKIAQESGYLPIDSKHFISEKDVAGLRPNQICVIATGSQGQFRSAMSRIAGNSHRYVKIEKGDKVLFSSDPIPGNEDEVYELIESLYLMGAEVRYTDIHDQLHASGHGSQGDMLLLMKLVNAKYLIPIGGTVRHQRIYRDLAHQVGYKDSNVFLLREGETVWFTKNSAELGDPVHTQSIYVDAYGVGDVGDTILRDRKTLSKEGIVFGLVKITNEGTLVEVPEFVSRGFIFDKHNGKEDIFEGAGKDIVSMTKKNNGQIPSKRDMIDRLEKYFYKATSKKPLVVLEVIKI